MEASAALSLIEKTWERGDMAISKLVINDDSSMRANLQWNVETKIQKGQISEWPRTKEGRKKNDRGLLPKEVDTEPKCLCYRSHWTKVYGKYLYILVADSKSVMKKADAIRLKKNFGYWLKQTRNLPIDEMKEASKAIVDHHINNHQFCLSWCPYKVKRKNQKKNAAKAKFRCIEIKEEQELYVKLTEMLERFTMEEKLNECHHPFSSQRNERF